MNTRSYKMRKRADQVAETRQRITEAAMRLHTTVGPAHTTISGVAEEAGVTRVTVYNHFADEEALFLACSSHWASLHRPPDPARWEAIADIEDRTRTALSDLYAWYQANHGDLHLIMRDFEVMPPAFRKNMRETFAALGKALVIGTGVRGHQRKKLVAVTGHVTSFSTWQSLVLQQGLTNEEAVGLATTFVCWAGGE